MLLKVLLIIAFVAIAACRIGLPAAQPDPSERCSQNELVSVVHAARRRGVLSVLAAYAPQLADYERAMAAGCRGVLTPADSTERAASFLAAATMMQRVHALDQQDLQAIRARCEMLKQRCAEQKERFQDTQETYFLDVSRVMTIISNIMDGIVFADRDGNVTLLNPVAEDLLGVKAFAAIGKPIASLSGCTELLQALRTLSVALAVGQEIMMSTSEAPRR